LGDCIGVIIFAPLFLIFFSFSDQHWKSRRFTVGVPLIVTFVIAVLGFNYVQKQEKIRLKGLLYEQAKILAFALDSENRAHLDMLLSVESFLLAEEVVTRKKFNNFARTILDLHSDLQALVWIVNTDKNKTQNTERLEFSSLLTKYMLSRSGAVPVGDIDVLTRREHRRVMLSAWLHGKPYTTKPIPLIGQGIATTPLSYTIYLPVFSSLGSANHRLIGFVSAVFNLKEYAHAVFRKFNHQDLVIRIWDKT
jgi:CHASE1-domain containing sensor protein